MRIGMAGRLTMCAVFAGVFFVACGGRALAQDKAADKAAPATPAVTAEKGTPVAPGLNAKSPEKGEKQAEQPNMNFWTIVSRAGWFGELIWLSLFICSIICVALIIDSYITIQESKIAPPALVQEVRTALEQGDLMKAYEQCDKSTTPLSRILKAGFSNAQEGFEVVQDAVGVAADLEGENLLQRVTYLSVISNTTPMLGLIGTVQGMIYAFFTLGTKEVGAAQQSLLALNISHGLWATAVGLGTAVPAGIYFFYFKNRATRFILHMEATTLDLIKTLRNVEVVEE